MMKKKLLLAFFATLLLNQIVVENISEARPGGGSSFRSSRSSSRSYSSGSSYKSRSYSSGSSYKYRSNSSGSSYSYSSSPSSTSYSSSNSDISDGEAIIILICFIIFIIVMIALGISILKYLWRLVTQEEKTTILSSFNREANIDKILASNKKYETKVKNDLDKLKELDPNFSKILFLEFINSIFNKLYTGYGKPELLKNLKPYLNQNIIDEFSNKRGEITSVVAGSIDLLSVTVSNDRSTINIEIDANYTLINNGYEIRNFVLEKWQLSRKAGVNSKEPEAMRALACPSCGGANNITDAGECNYCGNFIARGEMQWSVDTRYVIDEGQLSGTDLTGYVQEEGTDLPSIKQPQLNNFITTFSSKHSITNWDSYFKDFKEKIAISFFNNIYTSWSNNKLGSVRPFLSDRLYESFCFWIANYKKNGFTNRLDSIEIKEVELVKIELDNFYEAFTVRIYASCFDYIINKSGTVMAGSKAKKRVFTEYWTFIRRTGIEFKELEFNITACPSCGAPITETSQSADCSYCGSKINNGDYSWVLTIITQDEVYKG